MYYVTTHKAIMNMYNYGLVAITKVTDEIPVPMMTTVHYTYVICII